jgi:hypothetical protein
VGHLARQGARGLFTFVAGRSHRTHHLVPVLRSPRRQRRRHLASPAEIITNLGLPQHHIPLQARIADPLRLSCRADARALTDAEHQHHEERNNRTHDHHLRALPAANTSYGGESIDDATTEC